MGESGPGGKDGELGGEVSNIGENQACLCCSEIRDDIL